MTEELSARLAALIAAEGPIPLERYMAEANAHYYASRDPLGADGDFITAPEISQMFGELIGLWLADLWSRARRPAGAHYVELGPGRGTLAADALRAMRAAGLAPPIRLVETSPALRALQAENVPGGRWHDTIDSLPANGPLLVVANEFFDALPVRQLVAEGGEWRERCVDHHEGRFKPVSGRGAATDLPSAADGTIRESSPASLAIVTAFAGRLESQGGAAIIIDYGHERSGFGDTLQAVKRHAFADPWEEPGTRDLTAHVDFEALEDAAREAGVRVFGPREQGEWLQAMGINLRAASLAKAAPHRAAEIAAARDRLTSPAQMGRLFKVLALVARNWPQPEGF